MLRQAQAMFDNYGFDCQVLAASIRHTAHVVDALLAGADVITKPFGVLQTMIRSLDLRNRKGLSSPSDGPAWAEER